MVVVVVTAESKETILAVQTNKRNTYDPNAATAALPKHMRRLKTRTHVFRQGCHHQAPGNTHGTTLFSYINLAYARRPYQKHKKNIIL